MEMENCVHGKINKNKVFIDTRTQIKEEKIRENGKFFHREAYDYEQKEYLRKNPHVKSSGKKSIKFPKQQQGKV